MGYLRLLSLSKVCTLLCFSSIWNSFTIVEGKTNKEAYLTRAIYNSIHGFELPQRQLKVAIPPAFQNQLNTAQSKVQIEINKAARWIPRLDPLNGFKEYNGGFNVTSIDYLASLAFVGIWGYALALVCLIAALVVCITQLCCCLCGCRKHATTGNQNTTSYIRRIIIIFLSLAALIAASLIFWGTDKAGKRVNLAIDDILNSTDYILGQAEDTSELIMIAEDLLNDPTFSSSVQQFDNFDTTAKKMSSQIDKMKKSVARVIKYVILGLNILTALIFVCVFLGLVSSMYAWRCMIIFLFCIVAILIIFAWLLGGIDYTMSNVVNDSCGALKEFTTNHTNSSLANFVSCQPDATSIINAGISGIKKLINQANTMISTGNSDAGTSMPQICDPYGASPTYTPTTCPVNQKLMENFDNGSSSGLLIYAFS